MADFLHFKGARSVTRQQGSEMRLRRPQRGGDTFQTKRWWGKSNIAIYVQAAIFHVESSIGDLNLVIPLDPKTTELSIRHQGDGNFTFSNYHGVERCAVFSADRRTLYTEYQFPKISAGSILKRIVTPLPSPILTSEIGTVSIAGDATPQAGTASTYSATIDGNAGNLSYAWSTTDPILFVDLSSNMIIRGQGTNTIEVDFGNTNPVIVACTVTSTDENVIDSPQTGTLYTNPVANFAAQVSTAVQSFVVTVNNGEYELDGVANAAITANAGDTLHFDVSDSSMSGHPLKIYTDASKRTQVTVGFEQQGDDIIFTPPIPGTLDYQCENHADMGGTITIS